MKKSFLLVIAFLFFTSLKAQTDLGGDWSGAISILNVDLGMVVHFKTEGGTYSGTMDIPEQSAFGLKLCKCCL